MHKLKMSMSDTFTMVSRSMKHTTRHVEILIVTALLPFMQLLMMVFILGGTMEIGDYTVLDYVLPGIILMTIASGASMTAISVKEDMMNGIVDRFRTIDIGKTAVLNGHMAAMLLRCFLTTTLILVTAIFIGFCTNIGFTEDIATFIIIFSFIMMYTWAAILWGLVCPSLEAVGSFTYIGMLFPYVSSCFVPIDTMPMAMQGLAKFQPFTLIVVYEDYF